MDQLARCNSTVLLTLKQPNPRFRYNFTANDHNWLSALQRLESRRSRRRGMDDFPAYVASGTADLGVVGRNLIDEEGADITEPLPLGYGHCAVVLVVSKHGYVTQLADLNGKRIATTYHRTAKRFLTAKGIRAELIKLSGALAGDRGESAHHPASGPRDAPPNRSHAARARRRRLDGAQPDRGSPGV